MDGNSENSEPGRPKVRLTHTRFGKNASAGEIYEYLVERAERDGSPDQPPRPERGASPGSGRGTQEQ
jgi:hypothetical protein